ncbi:hypothetical protein ACRAWD_10230 [Caulobacter segnis]
MKSSSSVVAGRGRALRCQRVARRPPAVGSASSSRRTPIASPVLSLETWRTGVPDPPQLHGHLRVRDAPRPRRRRIFTRVYAWTGWSKPRYDPDPCEPCWSTFSGRFRRVRATTRSRGR